MNKNNQEKCVMRRRSIRHTGCVLAQLLAAAAVVMFCFAPGASAQGRGTVDSGTTIVVRTNEYIDSENNDGRVFRGTVQRNVLSRDGDIAIPRGSAVEM